MRALEQILRAPGRLDRVRHQVDLPPVAARTTDWPDWVAPSVREAFARSGIEKPWLHQVTVAEHAWAGQHVVVATGTASGKSLGYAMPALTAITEARGTQGQRGATALYLAPTKALAQDQLTALAALDLPGLRLATFDGDCTEAEREWARDHGEYVFTNPDMVHHTLLSRHRSWAPFFKRLRYVVVDELHAYRGIFGAHVAQIMRRLMRVAEHYGAAPVVIAASATLARPGWSASRLVGAPVVEVTDDASGRGPRTELLWQPPEGRPVTAEVADLVADLVVEDVATLAFLRSRNACETVARTAQGLLREVASGLAARVAAYRGGYLPEERRELEQRLRSRDLLAVASTSALELGIDISGLDAVITGGFPGTRAALRQQWGRAGRTGSPALGVLIASEDPLDAWLVNHPEFLSEATTEALVFDPDNPLVLAPHLCAAAWEIPIIPEDLARFGPHAEAVLEQLTADRLLRRRPTGWYWTHAERPHSMADLRSAGPSVVDLVDQDSGRIVGTVDGAAAPSSVHPGAVYRHQADTWVVDDLDLDEGIALLHREEPDYLTSARSQTLLDVVSEHSRSDLGPTAVSFGDVAVTVGVTSWLKRRSADGQVIGEYPLDLPPRTITTQAVWWTLPDDLVDHIDDLPGAAHAAEHASIGLLPLFATCDRWDLGGLSTVRHADTGQLTVFVYDGHPGGAGFARRGYEICAAWLTATRELIRTCRCESGCPSCIQSPKCGNQNSPLDKVGAAQLLDVVLQGGAGTSARPNG